MRSKVWKMMPWRKQAKAPRYRRFIHILRQISPALCVVAPASRCRGQATSIVQFHRNRLGQVQSRSRFADLKSHAMPAIHWQVRARRVSLKVVIVYRSSTVHPRTKTMPLSNYFDPDSSSADIAEAVREDGYAVVEGLLDRAGLKRLRADLDPWIENTSFGDEDFWGHRTKRFGALISKSAEAQQLLVNPTVLGVADEILLPWCANYWANYSGVMYLAPGEKAQSLHRDTNLWPFTNPSPPLTLATMWAVSDFTTDNGGTLVVPGSHEWSDDRTPSAGEVFATEMPAGSVLLYSGNTIHAGGSNRSDGARFGVALHYVLGWLRQEETQLLTVTPEQALALPESVRRLMGYSLGASSLGMVDHLDPHHHLTGVKEDKPKALSSPELDANEAKMHRLTVTGSRKSKRTYINLDSDLLP